MGNKLLAANEIMRRKKFKAITNPVATGTVGEVSPSLCSLHLWFETETVGVGKRCFIKGYHHVLSQPLCCSVLLIRIRNPVFFSDLIFENIVTVFGF